MSLQHKKPSTESLKTNVRLVITRDQLVSYSRDGRVPNTPELKFLPEEQNDAQLWPYGGWTAWQAYFEVITVSSDRELCQRIVVFALTWVRTQGIRSAIVLGPVAMSSGSRVSARMNLDKINGQEFIFGHSLLSLWPLTLFCVSQGQRNVKLYMLLVFPSSTKPKYTSYHNSIVFNSSQRDP